ncbi:hypothetical protein HDU93_006686 [Gonapodya sp. JEL0774]|nr:hypothetical protein HDU93_006686 [Gonapodya sp. JEL0774]
MKQFHVSMIGSDEDETDLAVPKDDGSTQKSAKKAPKTQFWFWKNKVYDLALAQAAVQVDPFDLTTHKTVSSAWSAVAVEASKYPLYRMRKGSKWKVKKLMKEYKAEDNKKKKESGKEEEEPSELDNALEELCQLLSNIAMEDAMRSLHKKSKNKKVPLELGGGLVEDEASASSVAEDDEFCIGTGKQHRKSQLARSNTTFDAIGAALAEGPTSDQTNLQLQRELLDFSRECYEWDKEKWKQERQSCREGEGARERKQEKDRRERMVREEETRRTIQCQEERSVQLMKALLDKLG